MNYKLTSMSVKKSIAIIIIIIAFFAIFSPSQKKEYIERGGVLLELFKEEGGCKYYRHNDLVMKQCK